MVDIVGNCDRSRSMRYSMSEKNLARPVRILLGIPFVFTDQGAPSHWVWGDRLSLEGFGHISGEKDKVGSGGGQ